MIVGFDGDYAVSSCGRVWSKKSGAWKELKRTPDNNGYLHVSLCRFGKVRNYTVHRLVLEAFVGPRPDGMEARHLNGRKNDNRAFNLAWGTRSENEFDKQRHGNGSRGSGNPSAKLTEDDVKSIRTRLDRGERQHEIGSKFGVCRAAVGAIKTRKNWRHIH